MGSSVSAVNDVSRSSARVLSAGDLERRLRQRRQMLILQAASYALGDIVLWIYAYAGTISIVIPSMFLLVGISVTVFFAVLSELHVGDQFDDHFLTIPQATANIIVQLGFLVAAPEIGLLFLVVMFVIFGFAALRMTYWEAAILWTLASGGVAVVFFFAKTPIALPMGTTAEWLAGSFSFVVTIGQSTYTGLFGNAMRRKLHRRSIELRIANQRIEELAQLDDLTGLLNRRYILKSLNEEVVRAQRTGIPCSVAVIDVDFFKRINDRFGHPAGDEALRTFGIGLFANIRTIDRLGRYGGEEFLLVLPDATHEQAVQTLDRLRLIISELDWSAILGDMNLTMSAGVCTVRKDESVDALLVRADAALYRAKDAGRNRVVAA
jgi:diguanylate cyclase (GGDEF)-like protein